MDYSIMTIEKARLLGLLPEAQVKTVDQHSLAPTDQLDSDLSDFEWINNREVTINVDKLREVGLI